MHVAKLQPVRPEDRADRIAVVVDQQDGVVARDHSDELVVGARRGKRAGETAAILLVYGHGERDVVEPRLGRWRRRMMGIAGAEDDRLALAFPSAGEVGNRTMRRRGGGGKDGEYDNPGKLRHGRGPPGVHRLLLPVKAPYRDQRGDSREQEEAGKKPSLNVPRKEPGEIIEHVRGERKCKSVLPL